MTARYHLPNVRVAKLVATIPDRKKSKLKKPEFAELTMRGLYTGINNLNTITNQWGRPCSRNDKHNHIAILKRFLIWMVRNGYTQHMREITIRNIRNHPQNNITTPKRAIEEASNPENRTPGSGMGRSPISFGWKITTCGGHAT